MRALIDTDVLVDVSLAREPWGAASRSFLKVCEGGAVQGFVAWHSMSNLYYYVRKKHDKDPRVFIRGLLRFLEVAPVGTQELLFALRLNMTDFEDAMQIAAAVACGADHIVTRNTADYRDSVVPALTPAEFLERYTG